jgi:hypothetical protein
MVRKVMTDLEKFARLQFLDGLLGYLELRQWAFAAISAFTPPADGAEMQRAHYLYFSSLFGIIDLIQDFLEEPARAAFVQEVRAGFAQPGDYAYARTLRNVIVHAGVDPAMTAAVENGFVRALCPATVYAGNRKTPRSYSCSFRTMVELAEAANAAANGAVFALLGREQLLDPAAFQMSIDQTLAGIQASQHMPDWAKEGVTGMLGQMDYDAMSRQIAQSRIDRLLTLLGRT